MQKHPAPAGRTKNTARLLRQTVCVKALCSFVRKSSPDCFPAHPAWSASFFARRYTQYWFMLIPSRCECSASERCRLRGRRSLNCPEYASRLSGAGWQAHPPAQLQPDLFCVQCVLYRFLFGFAAGDAARQVGIGGHKAALRIIPHDLQPVGHCKIIIQRFHRFSPHSLRSAAPSQRRLF